MSGFMKSTSGDGHPSRASSRSAFGPASMDLHPDKCHLDRKLGEEPSMVQLILLSVLGSFEGDWSQSILDRALGYWASPDNPLPGPSS